MFKYECNAIRLPITSQPASVRRLRHHRVQLTGWLRKGIQQQSETFEITRLFPQSAEEENPRQFPQFLNDMRAGLVNAVCDGSYFPNSQTGTAAWIMESPNSNYCRWGKIQTSGERKIQNAYRSELMGITVLMSELAHIAKNNSVQASIAIGCDNKGAVEKLNRLQIPVNPNSQHFDLIQTIQQIMQESHMTFSFYWIKSHQDDNNELNELTRSEYLNVIVDSVAKSFNYECQVRDNQYHQDPLDSIRKCKIIWEDQNTYDKIQIRSLLGKTLRQLISSQNTKEYICYKKKIEPHDFHKVDWDQLQYSVKGTSRNMQIWLSKWITGFMGTGKHLQLIGYQAQNTCPRCLMPENIDHVLRCQSDSALGLWETEVNTLVEDMLQRQGCPTLMRILRKYLEVWHRQEELPSLLEYSRPYQTLII